MAAELRKTGISIVGDIPWGAHFCYFYETRQDLLDVLIPYFKTGLENKEYCLWVISNSELLTIQEATNALRDALPELDRYLAERSIEVVGHEAWFLSGNTFDSQRVANRFRKKLDEALARGYAGMRVNGSPAWLHDSGKKELHKFEAELDKLFPNERTIASCTYPLASINGEEIFDVVRTHQFAIARREGEWEVVETPELKQAKAEIKRLNEELEQRVVERTGQLAKAIEELTDEISVRKQSEVELSLAHQRLSYHVENTPLAVIEWDKDLIIKRWSKRAEEVFGWTASEALGISVNDRNFPVVHEEDVQAVAEISRQLIHGAVNRNLGPNRNYTKDGNVIYCEWYNSVLRDEDGNVVTILSLVHDVSERKKAEAALDERLRSETLVTELSAAFANVSPNEVDHEIERWLRSLVEFLGVDRASFLQFAEDCTMLYRSHSYTVPGIEPLPPPPFELKNQFPWITNQLRQGTTVKWSHVPDDMAVEAVREKEYAARLGVKSGLNIPVRVGGSVICAITFTSILTYRDWPDPLIARLRLVGEIFAGALERKHAVAALKKEKEILEKVFENIPVMIGFVGADGRVKLVNREWERTIGWTIEELEDQKLDIFTEAYPDPAYRKEVLDFVAASTGEWLDLKIRIRDGRVIDVACAVVHLSDGTKVAIAQDISERKIAEEKRRATTTQLRALSARLQSAREEEGVRIAREIHDELGNALSTVRWDLETVDKLLGEDGKSSVHVTVRERLIGLLGLVDSTLSSVRRIASELRPSVLDDLGLMEAIEWQAQQFQGRTGITCICDCEIENLDLTPEESTAIFRIFQEALTNILRHAEATVVKVSASQRNGYFLLTISDNGRGITDQQIAGTQTLGLLGMRERAHLIGAEIEFARAPGGGTLVILRIPIAG